MTYCYLHAKVDQDRRFVVYCAPKFVKKLEFCTSAAYNGLHVALAQHLLSFLLAFGYN